MKRFVTACLTALLFVAFPPRLAHADDASRRAKVVELFEAMHLDQMMAQMMPMVLNQTRTMMQQQVGTSLPPEQQAKVDALQTKLFAVIEDEMSWPKLEPAMIDLYAETYTESEIDGILVFYRSPAGQAMLAKTPQLAARSVEMTQGRMQAVMPKVQKIVMDFLKENAPGASGEKGQGSSQALPPAR